MTKVNGDTASRIVELEKDLPIKSDYKLVKKILRSVRNLALTLRWTDKSRPRVKAVN